MTSEIPQPTMMPTSMPHPNMIPSNGYIGGYHQGMPIMPSTSNGIMSNFSMDDPNTRNSCSPLMMQQQGQKSPLLAGSGQSNFMAGHSQQLPSSMPTFHSNNPSMYSSSGQPMPNFQNSGISQQFYQNSQQPPTCASPGRLNTPNYPLSNALNTNNTPTYPNHNNTPTYPNPSNNQQQNGAASYQNNGTQVQNFSSEYVQNQDDRNGNQINSQIIRQQNFQNNDEIGYNNSSNNNFMNRDMNGYHGPPNSMLPPSFQRQMSINSNIIGAPTSNKKINPNKTMLFNSEMLNEMANSCIKDGITPENWHSNNTSQNNNGKGQRKRKAVIIE